MTNIRVFTIIIIVLLGLSLPGSSMARPGSISSDIMAANSSWQITEFLSENDQGRYSSLDLDPDGDPHISFLDYTTDEIKYVHRQGDDWEGMTVDTLTAPTDPNTSLALNGSDQPHIAYPFVNPCSLGYANWDGAQWQLEKLGGTCTEYVQIALDGAGEPCVSYYIWTSSDAGIVVRCHNETGWQAGLGRIPVHYSFVQEKALYHSLLVENDGTPHLSFYRQLLSNPAQLWYAWHDGDTWWGTAVDEGPDVGSYSSLELDEDGYPCISYYDHGNGDLKYVHWNGSEWDIETIDSSGDIGVYTSLELDGSGNPHISYYDATNANLKYAYWDGSQWLMETVDSEGEVGEWTSLALDDAGNAHISYYDRTNGNLKYATNSSAQSNNVYLPLALNLYP
ncbi:MAG: hypothetical protein PVF74_08260 [Anaerolineales bacterium]|jgi:hypothetical protein